MTALTAWRERRRRNSPEPPDGEPAKDMRALNRDWRRHTNSHVDGLRPRVDPARDHLRGRPDAKLVLVEYGDYASASCRSAAAQVRDLRERFGDELLFVFRNFTIADAHPNAFSAASAAEAAGAQGRFWEMHDRIYASELGLEPAATRRFAVELQLDIDSFDSDIATGAHNPHLFEDFNSGVDSGVNGAPTFFVNGARLDWDFETASLGDALRAAAKATR